MSNVKAQGTGTAGFFGSLREKLGRSMRNLSILIRMQLKEKLNFKRKGLKNTSVFDIIFSVVLTVLKFALVTAMCIAFIFAARLTNLFAYSGGTVPPEIMSILFTVMLILSIISCTGGLTKALYYSRDNAVLLTLPATPTEVYLSKFFIFFVFELKRSISFIIPMFLAYFAMHGYSVWFYLWLPIAFIFISFMTVSIGALLSIPSMYVCNFFRQHKYLQISAIVITVAAAIVAMFYGVAMIPSRIDLREDWKVIQYAMYQFLGDYTANLGWLFDITKLIVGDKVAQGYGFITVLPALPTFLRLLLVLGIGLAFFIAGMLIVRPLFYGMASKPFEYLKKETKPKPNRVHKRRVAALGTEFLVAIKNPARIFANVAIIVAIPLLIFFLNKIFFAMDTREMGDYMITAFNTLIILLVALNSNTSAASIFSRDGRSSYLIKSQPSKYLILILGKLLPDTASVCISLIVTFVILLITTTIGWINLVLFMIGIGTVYLAHMLGSAELDLMNPQIEIYATVGSSENNPNEIKSTLRAFAISFGIAFAMFWLLLEGGKYTYLKFALVGIAALIYRAWLFFTRIRLYYKER